VFMSNLKSVVLVFFALMVSGKNCLSQNFGSQDTRWTFDYLLNGITEVFYEKDTFLFDKEFRKFLKRNTNINSGDTVVFDLDPVYFNDDEGVVTYTKDLVYFDTLFNFNAEVGDTWTIYEDALKEDSMQIEVLDVFDTNINNIKLLSQSVSYTRITDGDQSSFVDTIYEDIGAKYLYILPFESVRVYPEGGILRCFVNEKLGIVDLDNAYLYDFYLYSTFEYECNDTITSIASVDETNFSFGPNPTSNNLYLWNIPQACKFVKLYDINGRKVKDEKVLNSDQELSLSGLDPGIYFIKLHLNSNRVQTIKFIKID